MQILFATNWKKCNTGDFAYRALKSLGHKVTFISPMETDYPESVFVKPDIYLPQFIDELDEKPDMFLLVEGSTGNYFFPRGITELSIPTAWWATDNYLNFRWHKEYAILFDYVFFVQLNRMELAKKAGAKNLHWLPFAADEQSHRDFNLERDIDVGYVGSIIDAKRRYFEKLQKDGVTLQTNDSYLLYEDVGRFYSRCKIVYNISARFDMNVRTFEACAAGALLINQSKVDDGFYKIFSPGVNADLHDFDDAAEIIRAYLADPEKLKKVAQAGKKTVQDRHTYKERMEEIMRVCGGGVTRYRKDRSDSWLRHAKEAMTYQHPHFRLWGRAFGEMKTALKKNFLFTFFYLLKYALFRVYEKAEKIYWKMGKAPV